MQRSRAVRGSGGSAGQRGGLLFLRFWRGNRNVETEEERRLRKGESDMAWHDTNPALS